MKKNKIALTICFSLLLSLLLSLSVSATAEELFDGAGTDVKDASPFSRPLSFISGLADRDFHVVYLVLFAICGILLCFYGYGLLRYCLGLLTFGGAMYAVYFVSSQLKLFSDARGKAICILVALIVGIVFSALAFCMTKFGAFLFVSIFSYLILCSLGNASIVFAVLSVAFGISASLFVRVSVIAFSSLVGGMTLGASLFGIAGIVAFPYIHIPLGLILSVLGMAVQFSFAKTKSEKKKERRERQRREKYEEEYEDDEYEDGEEYGDNE